MVGEGAAKMSSSSERGKPQFRALNLRSAKMSSSTDTKATSVSSQAVFFMERDECLRLIHEISSPDHVVVEDVEQAMRLNEFT